MHWILFTWNTNSYITVVGTNDIKQNLYVYIVYNGTQFVVMNIIYI